MATTFRQCTGSDLDLLSGLILDWHRRDGRAGDPSAVRRGLSRILADSGVGHAWIIEMGGFAVGYTMLTFSEAGGQRPPRSYVAALYLDAEHRGKGIGNRVERFLADVSRWLGMVHHTFDTATERKHAGLLTRVQPEGRFDGEALRAVA